MATYNSQMMGRGPYPQTAAAVSSAQSAPPGTFVPGTKVQVGNHRVVIDRYLSEGGFAHVYVVTLPQPVDGQQKGVLKRVAVPDKEHLANMRTEVETMKRLRGHKYIVKYIDSHASPLKSGGYEVFLLMEYCQGGGLIDFMNTRLQNRLTEPEILNIFTDIAEGVARMHYLNPPLLHRDLKIENVLISTSGKSRIYKLCDFGSAAPPRPAATSTAEGRLIEDDIQQHTTLQYRSPEMIDVYRKQPIDEKSDIWALGCFLYKLCYYTTPFEDVGQMAILNASFKYPGYPKFSDQLKLLIATMLREQPAQRPNIYQVLQKACHMDGRELQVKDIYSDRTQSEKRKTEVLPDPSASQSRAGASLAPPKQEVTQSIPDIAPMRRGRPSAPTSHHNSAKPSPSPLRIINDADPFANLDGKTAASSDELSSKFPTLDQFSLMTDKSSRFAFQSEQMKIGNSRDEELSKRVTHALADEAFARSSSPAKKPVDGAKEDIGRISAVSNRTKSLDTNGTRVASSAPVVPRKPAMVSVGTMTSPVTSPPPTYAPVSDRPIWHVPKSTGRSSSTGPAVKPPKPSRPPIMTNKSGSRLANLLKQDASKSQQEDEYEPRSASSARPSMEGGRPSLLDLEKETPLSRSRSLNIRNRPVSVNLGSGPTHIKDREIKKSELGTLVLDADSMRSETAVVESDTNIASDVDFLKAKEEEEKEKNKNMRRGSSKTRHNKRASLPSIALTGTKNILQGRFGEAFKKFEGNDDQQPGDLSQDQQDTILTPIAGSEATDLSEDYNAFAETEELSPEMRRELEKRQLEAEEKRVADAAAAYRQRAVGGSSRPPVPSAKAASIQNRVQSLLQESGGRSVQKTATGYGQYTDLAQASRPNHSSNTGPQFQTSDLPQRAKTISVAQQDTRPLSAPASQVNFPKVQKPTAPPKPRVLQTGRAETVQVAGSVDIRSNPASVGDDWEDQFSKRYPSLSHLEMVETEIEDRPLVQKMTIKEV